MTRGAIIRWVGLYVVIVLAGLAAYSALETNRQRAAELERYDNNLMRLAVELSNNTAGPLAPEPFADVAAYRVPQSWLLLGILAGG